MIFFKKQQKLPVIPSDPDLVRLILTASNKEEQRGYQKVLYERYAAGIYYKCLSILKNKETAKDLAHDIIIKIFLNLSKYSGKGAFASWVYTIAYNHCISHIQKTKKLKFEGSGEELEIAADEEELANKLLKEIQLDKLERLLEQLKEEDKIILLMRYQDAMSIKQIALALSIGESAVKMRLKRSRDYLARLMKDDSNE